MAFSSEPNRHGLYPNNLVGETVYTNYEKDKFKGIMAVLDKETWSSLGGQGSDPWILTFGLASEE